MRYFLILFLFPLFSFNLLDDKLLPPSEMVGIWLTHKQDAKIEVYESNGKYYGKAIWAKNYELPDYEVFILDGFKPKGKSLRGGKIFNPDSGKKYKSVIKLKTDGKLHIKVKLGFLFKTIHWTRVK